MDKTKRKSNVVLHYALCNQHANTHRTKNQQRKKDHNMNIDMSTMILFMTFNNIKKIVCFQMLLFLKLIRSKNENENENEIL